MPQADFSFNATEFRTGIAFRFDTREKARIGNGRISIPREAAKNIRIADIVAASSCFPGGFEPLAFPDDFVWPEGRVPSEIQEAIGEKPIALMDGGIYDNQGITTLDLGIRARAGEFGLVIISDVDQKSTDLYPFPARVDAGLLGRFTLGQVYTLLRLVRLE